MKCNFITLIAYFALVTFYAQTTPIPDPAFEAELIAQGIDTNGMNGNILNSDAEGVETLNVSNSGISNLAGIEAFVDVLILDCEDNMLSSLDLTFNTVVNNVDCNNNMITNINLNSNSGLVGLNASDNLLTSIDFSNNPALNSVTLNDNQFTELDFSANSNLYQIIAHDNNLTSITFPPSPTLLEIVWVYNNDLTSIDLTIAPILATLRFENNDLTFLDLRNGNNMNINTMDARDNPDLEFICVDDVSFATNAPNWNKDSTAQYSEDCALGVSDFKEKTLFAYPNPTTGVIQLESKGHRIESLELISANGMRFPLKISNTIELNQFASGLYLLNARMEDGRTETIRIVKR